MSVALRVKYPNFSRLTYRRLQDKKPEKMSTPWANPCYTL